MQAVLLLTTRNIKADKSMFKTGDIVKIVGMPRNLSAEFITSRGKPIPVGLIGEIIHVDPYGYDVDYTVDAWWFDEDALCVPSDEELLAYKLGVRNV